MPKYRIWSHYDGGDMDDYIEVDSLEEAEDCAKEMAMERLEWGAEIISETPEPDQDKS